MGCGYMIQTETHDSISDAYVELTGTTQGLQDSWSFLEQQLEANVKIENSLFSKCILT